MKRGHFCILSAAVLMLTLTSAAVAEDPHTIVTNDGRSISAETLGLTVGSMSATPQRGGAPSAEALMSQGVNLDAAAPPAGLRPAPAGGIAEALVGTDTRSRNYTDSYPSSAVALIYFDPGYLCTGWMVGWDTVVTAGHCVHSGGPTGSWYSGHMVYPAYDGSTAPYGYCTASWTATVVGWASRGLATFDYGVIKLNCDVGYSAGWFGFVNTTAIPVPAYPTTTTGYPGDKTAYEQWESHDKVRSLLAKQLLYWNDTYGGMSGSPVWFDDNRSSTVIGPYCIGIHAYGPYGAGAQLKCNRGTRIDSSVFKNLLSGNGLAGESCRVLVHACLALGFVALACGGLHDPGEPDAKGRGSVEGQASTTNGVPVVGALVEPRSLDDPSPPIPEIAVRTDKDGRFVWPLFAGSYEVTVVAEGCERATARVVVKAGRVAKVSFSLRCTAPAEPVSPSAAS